MFIKTPKIEDRDLLEERTDLSVETQKVILKSQLLVDKSILNLHDALTILTAHEKQCRIKNDAESIVSTSLKILQICRECKNENILIDTINYLANRRNQKPKVITAIVQRVVKWLLGSEKEKYILINTKLIGEIKYSKKLVVVLRDIAFGNISLEHEMAKLSRILAFIKENEGDTSGASDTLKAINVESYGSLSKREKTNFLLEHLRLTIDNSDYVQTAIVSSKIAYNTISKVGMEEEKVLYFSLMTKYHGHFNDAFELAKDYYEIFHTCNLLKKQYQWKQALQNTVFFLTLSPYSIDQQSMIKSLSLDPLVHKIVTCRNIIKIFTRREIVNNGIFYYESFETLNSILKGGMNISKYWKNIFYTRLIQHNIRVVALCYRRIHGNKLAKLLGVNHQDLEPLIADMISNKQICAKIDRPKDIVYFSNSTSSGNTISNWVSSISLLLRLLDKTTHLINKNYKNE